MVLTVLLDDKVVCEVALGEVPCEKQLPALRFDGGAKLVFRTRGGVEMIHNLDYEQGYLHMSVRVLPNSACMVDAAVTQQPEYSLKMFDTDEAQGIRFQPFFLDSILGHQAELKGAGLFERGLHFPGMVTPSSITLSCCCDECRKSFRLLSYHMGFSNQGYFYSGSGTQTLLLSAYTPGCPPVTGNPPEDMEELSALEARLPPAADGTRFSCMNALRCPYCGAAYIDFAANPPRRWREYYGNILVGVEAMYLEVGPE